MPTTTAKNSARLRTRTETAPSGVKNTSVVRKAPTAGAPREVKAGQIVVIAGRKYIRTAADPHQLNPIHDAAHEKAAIAEAKILTDKKAKPHEKVRATIASNKAEGAPAAHTLTADGATKLPPAPRTRARRSPRASRRKK